MLIVLMVHPTGKSRVLLCPQRRDYSCVVRNPWDLLLTLEEVIRIGWVCGTACEAGIILIFQGFGLQPCKSDGSSVVVEWVNSQDKEIPFSCCFLGATFDPFGAPSKPSGQDLLGSFLNTASASSDPFLQPTRSPSPTVHGEEVFYIVFSGAWFSTDSRRCSDVKAPCRWGFFGFCFFEKLHNASLF